MRKRSFHRSSHSATKVRTFWVRNTGAFTVTSSAGVSVGSTVFDPLLFLPDPTATRVDINRDVTIKAVHMNWRAQAFLIVGGGTEVEEALYFGVSKIDRNVASRSAAFSAADDARTDWMDCWMDTVPVPTAANLMSRASVSPDRALVERFIKTKRKLQSEDLLVISMAKFPFAGTASTVSVVVQWQASVLLTLG